MTDVIEGMARAIWRVRLCDYCSTDSETPLTPDCCAVKAAQAAMDYLKQPQPEPMLAPCRDKP